MVLLLRVVVLAGNARRGQVSRYSALLLSGIAAYVVDSAPGFGALDLRLRLRSMSSTAVRRPHSGSRWARSSSMSSACAGITRSPGWRWLALGAVDMCSPLDFHRRGAFRLVTLLSSLLGIWHALAGRAMDLVEGRRRLRVRVCGCDRAVRGADRRVGLALARRPVGGAAQSRQCGRFDGASSSCSRCWARCHRASRHGACRGPRAGRTPSPPTLICRIAPSPTGADAALLAALRKLIDHDKVYREPDLSVASLAHKLDIPEHRLRRLINRQLGHRNFSAFVNGYRLAEAETALGDPAQAAVPILTIALDAGFGSIGPFNRAFKAHTGLTPTEYRRARLEGARASMPRRFRNWPAVFRNSASPLRKSARSGVSPVPPSFPRAGCLRCGGQP